MLLDARVFLRQSQENEEIEQVVNMLYRLALDESLNAEV
jgi:hypothetical protein